jgi:hypothetical protein
MELSAGIGALLHRMEGLLAPLEAGGDPARFFLATYLRTTRAVADELARGGFRDPEWVERWDVAFAGLYLDAVEAAQAGRRPPEPWAVAFGAGDRDDLPPLRHVLLGMNAHINFDLAQSLLAVISEPEFDDPGLLAARRADHEHIDQVLVARVGAEDTELEAASGPPQPHRPPPPAPQPPGHQAVPARVPGQGLGQHPPARHRPPRRPRRLRRPPGPARAARRHPRRRPHGPRPGRPQARRQGVRGPPPRRLTRRGRLWTAPGIRLVHVLHMHLCCCA